MPLRHGLRDRTHLRGQTATDNGLLRIVGKHALALRGLGARLETRLAERLGNFDQNGAITSEPYVAKAFRATLTWQQGGVQGVQISAWPWEDLTVADFTFPADPNQLPQGIHLITADQVAALNIAGAENGLNSGFWTQAGDGRTFSLSIRPLLPEEKE